MLSLFLLAGCMGTPPVPEPVSAPEIQFTYTPTAKAKPPEPKPTDMDDPNVHVVESVNQPLVLDFYTSNYCAPCKQAIRDMRRAKWDRPVLIVIREPRSDIRSIPHIEWTAKGKRWFATGWNGLDDFRARVQKTEE